MGILEKIFIALGIMNGLKNKTQNIKNPVYRASDVNSLNKQPSIFFCEYCGQKFSSVKTMVINNCPRHPDGSFKGRHKLYEGREKTQYVCKYCGQKFTSIQSLTTNKCLKHPDGSMKGRHSPAL